MSNEDMELYQRGMMSLKTEHWAEILKIANVYHVTPSAILEKRLVKVMVDAGFFTDAEEIKLHPFICEDHQWFAKLKLKKEDVLLCGECEADIIETKWAYLEIIADRVVAIRCADCYQDALESPTKCIDPN